MNRIAAQMISFFRRFELIETESTFRKEIKARHIILDEHDFEVYLTCLLKATRGKENTPQNQDLARKPKPKEANLQANKAQPGAPNEKSIKEMNLVNSIEVGLKKTKSRPQFDQISKNQYVNVENLDASPKSKKGNSRGTKTPLTEQETEDIMEGLMNRLFNKYTVAEPSHINTGIDKLIGNKLFQKLYRDTDVLKEAFEESESDSVQGKHSVIRNRVLESQILQSQDIPITQQFVESEVWHTVKHKQKPKSGGKKTQKQKQKQKQENMSPGRRSVMYELCILRN